MRWWLAVVAGALAACGSVGGDDDDDTSGPADAAVDACVAESDEAFCARLERTCDPVAAADNCGTPRETSCGTCEDGQGCSYGVCAAPQCADSYVGSPFLSVNAAGVQDDSLAISPSGRTVVHVRSGNGFCGDPFQIFVTDEITPDSGTFVTHEVPAGQLSSELVLFWANNTITPDGLTLVATKVGGKGFIASRRSALGATDFGTPDDLIFRKVNETVAERPQTLTGPAISADGREFFYSEVTVDPNTGAATFDLFRSRRADDSPTTIFPAGTRLPDSAQGYEFASGVSGDGLSLFVNRSFQTSILRRSSTEKDDFANPKDPEPAPSVGGWAVVPTKDCSVLIGISSIGGCNNEDVFRFDKP
jgi:hypothetical protein